MYWWRAKKRERKGGPTRPFGNCTFLSLGEVMKRSTFPWSFSFLLYFSFLVYLLSLSLASVFLSLSHFLPSALLFLFVPLSFFPSLLLYLVFSFLPSTCLSFLPYSSVCSLPSLLPSVLTFLLSILSLRLSFHPSFLSLSYIIIVSISLSLSLPASLSPFLHLFFLPSQVNKGIQVMTEQQGQAGQESENVPNERSCQSEFHFPHTRRADTQIWQAGKCVWMKNVSEGEARD